MLTSLSQIVDLAKEKGSVPFVVAGAHSHKILKAVLHARELKIMRPILIGDEKKIMNLAEALETSLDDVRIIQETEDSRIAEIAASLLQSGDAKALMKGDIVTSTLLKCVLKKEYGLRSGQLLSHVAFLEIPAYHKLLLMTDGGVIVEPDLNQKIAMLNNALHVARTLGINAPKVAVLAATEKVNANMPETEHAAELVRLNRQGEFGDAILEGPLAFDIAISSEAAEIKHFESRIAGEVDLLLMPNISCGNIWAKGLIYLGDAKICGVVTGARIPIALISRAEREETWLTSIALSALLS